MSERDDAALAAEVEAIAEAAGRAILAIYEGAFEVRRKADATPVTEADEAAEALIVARLRALTPEIPVVGEEMTAVLNVCHGATLRLRRATFQPTVLHSRGEILQHPRRLIVRQRRTASEQ